MGPKRQMRNMTKAKRRVATGIYLGMMVVTIFVSLAGARARDRMPLLGTATLAPLTPLARPTLASPLQPLRASSRVRAGGIHREGQFLQIPHIGMLLPAVVRTRVVRGLIHPIWPEDHHQDLQGHHQLLGRAASCARFAHEPQDI